MRGIARAAVLIALVGAALLPAGAQRPAEYDRGASGLVQALQRLTTTASALHTGAHPDDEDSAFLARLARGDHARVAYLSLTRGEGGQNILGPELFEPLGVIRTEELLQARRLDGAGQFFTRAFDFGFSKTRDETAARWDVRAVLSDMVRVMRTFRPLVVYSRFSGTASDGHGHHQMAGHLTREAFAAAGDPGSFPELAADGLRPWQPRKLYINAGRLPPDPQATLELATGLLHPVLGRSYAAIAAEGRSQHRSQQMGSLEPLGPASTTLRLIDSRVDARSAGLFDGIDTSVRGLAVLAGLPAGALAAELGVMADRAAEALERYEPLNPADLVPILAAGLDATRQARRALPSLTAPAASIAEADFLLAAKEEQFVDALARAAGVMVDPLAASETLTPGSATDVVVRTFAADPSLVRVSQVELDAPAGWAVSPSGDRPEAAPAGRRESPTHSAGFRVTAPASAVPTAPPLVGTRREQAAMYEIRPGETAVTPFGPPLLAARVSLAIGGAPMTLTVPVTHRLVDPVLGELRRSVQVVPPLSLQLDTPMLVVRTGTSPYTKRIAAQAVSHAPSAISGRLQLRVPAGWTVSPAAVPFTLERQGDAFSSVFEVRAPGGRRPGTGELRVDAQVAGATHASAMQVIAYPHIRTHRLYTPARALVHTLDVQVAPVRVGYIMGSGDQIPDALRLLGVDVTLLDDEALAFGDLARFDTIVAGIRAAEARPAFVRYASRLRDYMLRGGTLIVQYQQQEYIAAGMPPFPAAMTGNSRVTDEGAPVRMLVPDHPVFRYPNRISADDFSGWIQERNLYAFTTFDGRYTPLLETADPGEPAQRGGQLYAEVGKGRYVYTAYSWFRQLPAGVPGAWRLFANLVSLSRAPRPDARASGVAARTGGAVPVEDGRTRPSR